MSLDTIYLRAPIWSQNVLLNIYALRIDRHRYGRRFRAALELALGRERWPASRLQAYQDERIRALVRVAYERSPYYRRIMDERGLQPGDISGRSDLPKLPFLTKDVVRSRGQELLAGSQLRRGWRHGHTSGTTGSPLSVWYDRNTCVMTNAVDWRQKIWGGMVLGDWIGLFLGRVVVAPDQRKSPFWRVNRVQRQVWFSSFHMSEENLDRYVEEIRRRGLAFLEGYPSTLYILASHVIRRGERLPMRAVFTSSETLHRIQRETIESAFECRIFDFYGMAERVIFATECDRRGGRHLSEDFGFTEVVDDEGNPIAPGDRGYLVGTSLHNHAMPLIRYWTGDVSAFVPEPCACGRTFVRIESITTKAEDIVVTPDGRLLSPSILTHPFKPFHQILKSQIIQEALDEVEVRIVPSGDFTVEHERALKEGLRKRLGPDMKVLLVRMADIPREPSGKFRWVISRVQHPSRFSWETTPE